VAALRRLASEFPRDWPGSILIVIHLSSQFRSTLDAILAQAGPLPASFARDGERIDRGRIYIAPPGRHLLLDRDTLHLGDGPRENNSRPAIDPLFRSVGLCCGGRAVGVVLTGTLGDGSSGLQALKQCGGVTVVQDPEDAAFPEMPVTALNRACVDHIVGLAGMAALLADLVRQPAGPLVEAPENLKHEVEIARSGHSTIARMDHLGRRSVVTCPDCHGVMWEVEDGDVIRYRCHTGHAYIADLMSLRLDENLSRALGSALRALEERVTVARNLERHATEHGRTRTAESWAHKANELEKEADIIRQSIRRIDGIAFRYAQTG
jgi:two-component system, chemotaxis family, protein-glutamate methylesterase/glutaminase